MRTTSHTPRLGETITIPVDSVQHQMTILTLVTHMLLSVPLLNNNILGARSATNSSSTNTWNHPGHPSTQAISTHLVHVRSPGTPHRLNRPSPGHYTTTLYPHTNTRSRHTGYSPSRTRQSTQTKTPVTSNHTGEIRRHQPNAALPSLIPTCATPISLTLSHSSPYSS